MRIHLTEKELRALSSNTRCHTVVSKYHNRKTVVDGMTFDSKAEAERYSELVLMEKAGLITGWILKEARPALVAEARQQRFPLEANGKLIGVYVADFVYAYCGSYFGVVIEDVKGFATQAYKLKKKLFQACYGFPIIEYRKKGCAK